MAFSGCRLALLCVTAALASASANDTASSVTAEGIVFRKSDSIAMKKELLEISPDRIRVSYEFRNESKAPIETDVSFPMPTQRSSAHYYHSSARFEDFSVKVDGKKKEFRTDVRAIFAKDRESPVDITNELKALNLPVETFPDVAKLPAATLESLKAKDWISDVNPDHLLDADWQIQRIHSWKQLFPPGKTVRIEHAYQPVLGGDSLSSPRLDWSAFAEPEWDERSAELIGTRETGKWLATNLSYVLTTGNNWKAGIEDFELRVTGAPVILLRIGTKQDFDLENMTWKKKDFRPSGELAIEFLSPRPAHADAKPATKGKPKPASPRPDVGALGLVKTIDGPANCRDLPEKAAPIARTHENGVPVKLLERKGDWYRVTPDCWTHVRNLKSRLE